MLSDLLTIIIPTRDRPDFLELCLRSVYQNQQVVPHVTVSDNSTRDFETTESLRKRYGFSYVRQSGTLSMTDHHNACLRLAQTPWALLLHDDDELYPDSLANLELLIGRHLEAGVIVCGVQRIDERSAAHGAWVPEKTEAVEGEEGVLRLGLDFKAHPPSTLYNVEAFHEAGGFPDALGASADYPLILRLIYSRGLVLFPMILGRYRVGAQQATDFTLKGAERTLDQTIRMSELTRAIGISPATADRLVDYNNWWIFRITAGQWFESEPFFVSRLFRKCAGSSPADGEWKRRVRQEYPLLFLRPIWFFMLSYKLYTRTRTYLPARVRRTVGNWVVFRAR